MMIVTDAGGFQCKHVKCINRGCNTIPTVQEIDLLQVLVMNIDISFLLFFVLDCDD